MAGFSPALDAHMRAEKSLRAGLAGQLLDHRYAETRFGDIAAQPSLDIEQNMFVIFRQSLQLGDATRTNRLSRHGASTSF